MSLPTLVKVNSINNLSEARFCAGIGVELLGFNLCPSDPGFLSFQSFDELTGWLSGVKVVGEFFDAIPEQVKVAVDCCPLDYLETTMPEYLDELGHFEIPLIYRIDLDGHMELSDIRSLMDQHGQRVDLFLLEGESRASGPTIHELSQLGAGHPLLLGSGVTIQSVGKILNSAPIAGIALSGGREIKPGYYDFDQMAEILESIEVDN